MMRRLRSGLLAWGLVVAAPVLNAHDGDLTGNGAVEPGDLLWAIQALLGARSLTPQEQVRGDVAPLLSGVPWPDGILDTADLLVLQRMLLEGLDFSIPDRLFNIGDSIGEGEAADGTIGEAHHELVWSTGYHVADGVDSFNERFAVANPVDYYANSASRDAELNHAVSGSVMADFAGQAQAVADVAAHSAAGAAGSIAVFLGNNDVCADSLADMTAPAVFEAQYRAGLDTLAADSATRYAQIHVNGIPAIYWLWNAKRDVFWCWAFVWPFVPCQNLLKDAGDDCASSASREDPDNDYPGDGSNCRRRKQFHRIIRDTYNPILRNVLQEYRESGRLPNARYTDLYDFRFESQHVNGGDCFHPSTAGHALLADKAWCRAHWGRNNDPACAN